MCTLNAYETHLGTPRNSVNLQKLHAVVASPYSYQSYHSPKITLGAVKNLV